MKVALVVYEDSRGENGDFGPHELLMALVADEVEGNFWKVRQSCECVPAKGITKALKAIASLDRFRKLTKPGAPVLVIFDNDAIREKLSLPPGATEAQVIGAIQKRCDQPARLTIVLLQQNTETLVNAEADCAGSPRPRKGLNERDMALLSVARDAGRRSIRDCIRQRVPSIEPAIAFLKPLVRGTS
jgi:hypothetical protein